MAEKPVGEAGNGLFDAVAEMFADASALLEGDLVVAFEKAGVSLGGGAGEAGAVEKAVEKGEFLETLFFENGVEVDFDIGLAADKSAVAQKA